MSESRSRKNSAQFDSGSSSSEISVAIAEVTDKLRRTCGLTQQNTVDGGKSSKKLSAATCSEPRRASVSVPMSLPEVAASSGFGVSGDAEKTFKKSHSLTKACSVASSNPPIISVSSVADVENLSEEKGEEAAPGIVPMAPLAEPDSESPASEMPPELEEAKSNDVCPWEDE